MATNLVNAAITIVGSVSKTFGNILAGLGSAGSSNGVLYNNSGAVGSTDKCTLNGTTGRVTITDNNTASGSGLKVIGTNPNVSGDDNWNAAAYYNVRWVEPSITNPAFTNQVALAIDVTADFGQYAYRPEAGGSQAKKTFAAMTMTVNSQAAGQKFINIRAGNYYGMGDSFMESNALYYQSGPIAGDEGTGFSSVSYLYQDDHLAKTTITAVGPHSTLNTTTTQFITANKDIQTVTVASTTGASVGNWVVVQQMINDGQPNQEAVQITAVNPGVSISGRFLNNHSSGVTITPALVLTVDNWSRFGEQRVLVNLSGASYSTGTVSAITGGAFTGTGTSWTTNIVGGSSTNIGVIALGSDDYTRSPFDADTKRLKSWYEIVAVSSATSLGIHTFSVAADQAYRGFGVTGGPTAYIIRPGVRVLRINSNIIVCESTTTTWTVGDEVECAVCPYPDVTGYYYAIAAYTPGGTYRQFMSISNSGGRKFSYGISVGGAADGTGGSDNVGWDIGYIAGGCNTGMQIQNPKQRAISIVADLENPTGDPASRIEWNASQYLSHKSAARGLEFGTISVGQFGVMSFHSQVDWGTDDNRSSHENMPDMRFMGDIVLLSATGGTVRNPYVAFDGNTTNGFYFRIRSAKFSETTSHGNIGLTIEGVQRNGTSPDTKTKYLELCDTALRIIRPLELAEMTAPAAPPANNCYLYAEDNGSGKTRLMARFPTGAAVLIAIEP